MGDLISREALLEEIKKDLKEKDTSRNTAPFITGLIYRQFDIEKIIEEQPQVEAVPVVYGEWKNMAEHNDHLHCKCSICGFTTENYQAIKNWGISSDDYLEYKWNFCPKCGTRMRKKV